MSPRFWVLRPIVWFAAASMATTVLHELTHACVAYALGVRSTLFSYAVDLDVSPAATRERVLIGLSGPVMCLGLGLLAAFAFKRARGSAAELPWLYVAVFGLSTFFGNLMSAASVGDFSTAATALDVPLTARYAVAAAGAVIVAAIHFRAGRELVRGVPAAVGRLASVLSIIVLPVVLATAVVILVNRPMPATSVTARVAEASFWFFAVVGALTTRPHPPDSAGGLGLRWFDGAAIAVAVLAVRLMVRGIPFVP